jgi:glycosyltransferase involved in cell wall biosynthesis
MLAPLYESIPPRRYGGTERVVSYLTDELVRRGHDVTLFASGLSETAAHLVEVCPEPLNAVERLSDPVAYHALQIAQLLDRADQFDLVHSHCDYRMVPFAQRLSGPLLSTNHNRLDTPETAAIARAYPGFLATALSESHRAQLEGPRWMGVCHNAVPVEEFPFSERPGSYLAFLGRFSPEKGPLEAIEVARRSGIPLRIGAKVNPWERAYFEQEIRPRLDPPLVEYIGELGEAEKREFLRDALALLFPVKWAEPFGMVLIEAMATGTPVLAFPHGAVPEIVKNGETGFLCHDVADMAARVDRLGLVSRRACRIRVEESFSVEAMTDAYEESYRRCLDAGRASPPGPLPPFRGNGGAGATEGGRALVLLPGPLGALVSRIPATDTDSPSPVPGETEGGTGG